MNVSNEHFKCTRDFTVLSVLSRFSWCGQKPQNEDSPQLEGNHPVSFNSSYDKKNRNLKGSELKQLCEEVYQKMRVAKEANFFATSNPQTVTIFYLATSINNVESRHAISQCI